MNGHTVVLTISYDGSSFHGFARQPGLPTVQGKVEEALRTVLRREVETVGAGRTDAGVHALGQVMSFDADGTEPDAHSLLRSLNAMTGPDIVVTGVSTAPAGFSARFDATAREYRYRLVPGPLPPLFLRKTSWWVKHGLNLHAMRDGAAGLIGEHDFASFCVAESAEGKSTIRALETVEVLPEEQLGEHCVVVRVVGNAFLHSMVRVVVGTLVEVGRGHRPSTWVREVLEARDRTAAGPTAPPEGLTLWHVSYPDDSWL